MREIHSDLKERFGLLELQIKTNQAHFEGRVEQLKREKDRRLEDLKSELKAVNRLSEIIAWQQNARAVLAATVAAADVAMEALAQWNLEIKKGPSPQSTQARANKA